MARRQHQNSISLFPFLAVLVCAMGALILLLLVMTRKIRHDQSSEFDTARIAATVPIPISPPDRSEEIADLEAQLLAIQHRLVDTHARKSIMQASIDEQGLQQQSLELELTALQQQLSASEREAIFSGTAFKPDETKQLRIKEAALLRQLDQIEETLVKKQQQLTQVTDLSTSAALVLHEKNSALLSLRAQVQDAQKSVEAISGGATLLEFSNPTGTTRTPIVVDVSALGFEILPTGIHIAMKDLEGFPVRDNPLLSAILTTHRHRTKTSLTDEPYVLMLVRPEGCLPFYGAQRVLAEAQIHYGYELLEPDRKIVAGTPDLTEIPIVQAAIEEAFKRRVNLYSKLMAIAQQDNGQRGPGSDSEPKSRERRLSIRPDGRVVADEPSERRPLDGRFYAGGVAPPAALFRNRPVGGYRGSDQDRLTPADAEKLAEEFAARYAQQQAAARAAAIAGANAGEGERHEDVESPNAADAMRNSAERKFATELGGSDPSGEISSGRPDLSHIDPELLRRLQSARRSSSSLATPVGITVFLDEHHMTVGQQAAVEVTHDTLEPALAALMTGINTEVEDVRRDPQEPVMPIVKFIVSPGGEKWRIPLAQCLSEVGVHSAAVFDLTPYMISQDDTGHAYVENSTVN